jgi:hypothetical protein
MGCAVSSVLPACAWQEALCGVGPEEAVEGYALLFGFGDDQEATSGCDYALGDAWEDAVEGGG